MLLFALVWSRSKALTPSVSLKESISRVVESQIINDLRSSLSDVCDVMSSLDIAIGFLASSGGQPERPLKWYLHEVLKLPKDRGLKSATVSTILLFIWFTKPFNSQGLISDSPFCFSDSSCDVSL